MLHHLMRLANGGAGQGAPDLTLPMFHSSFIALDGAGKGLAHSIRRHHSEEVFGVLVVVLCPNDIAASGLLLSEREIPVVASPRALSVVRHGAGGKHFWSVRAGTRRADLSGWTPAHVAIVHGSFLDHGK
jgi:hypothetical protein